MTKKGATAANCNCYCCFKKEKEGEKGGGREREGGKERTKVFSTISAGSKHPG